MHREVQIAKEDSEDKSNQLLVLTDRIAQLEDFVRLDFYRKNPSHIKKGMKNRFDILHDMFRDAKSKNEQ